MSTMLRPALRVNVVLFALSVFVLAVAPAAHAQDDAFKKGMEFRSDKKWREAAMQMQEAIKANPKDDGHTVRSGILRRGSPYFPHVYLGEALANTNDCLHAVESWAIAEQNPAVRAHAEASGMVSQGYAACETAGILPPGKFDQLYTRVKAQVDDAAALAARVAAMGNGEAWRSETREQYNRANAEIANARARLEAARATRAEGNFTVAAASADTARKLFVTVESAVNTALAAQQRFSAQVREAEQLVAGAEDQDRAIDPRKGKLTAPVAVTYKEGHDVVGRARARLTAGRGSQDTAAVTEAVSLAKEASARFSRVIDELLKIEKDAQSRQLANAVSAAQEAFAFVDGAFITLDRLAQQKPAEMAGDKTAQREAIKKDVEQARRRFDSARKTENLATIAAVTRSTAKARDQLNALIATFGPVTLIDRGVHQALFEGAKFYLAGDYDKALAALNPAAGFAEDVPLRPQVHLIRAAALFALFERSARKDDSLRLRAVGEVEEYKQLTDAPPDARAFSPRFLNFVQGVSARPATAPPAPPAQ